MPNAYAEQLAAARRDRAAAAERFAASLAEAQSGQAAFASLAPRRSEDDRAARHLAAAASRRLGRRADPKTGGLDPGDRADLLRQADAMHFDRAAAEAVLRGVEAVYANRPAKPHAPADVPSRRLPTGVLVVAAVVLAAQALATAAWFWLGGV